MLVCDTDMLVSYTDMSVLYTDMSVLYTDMSVLHTYCKYVNVFACICTYFGKCQRPFARPRSLTRRRVIATVRYSSLVRRRTVAARSPRCRCGKFAARAAQAQANNQQIYLDQVH